VNYYQALWNHLVGLALAIARWSPPPCRAVLTSMGTFDGSGSGKITGRFPGAFLADDVDIEVNDRVFLPVTLAVGLGGTPADQGPYIVQQVGGPSNRYELVRPPEWGHGSVIEVTTTFRIAEGKVWAGNDWKAFPKTSKAIVDTDDPAFWPRSYTAVIKEDVVYVEHWIRDATRLSVQQLAPRPAATGGPHASHGSPHGCCLTVAVEGAGNGRVAVAGAKNSLDTYAVMAINY
jgi:hypothetical protein